MPDYDDIPEIPPEELLAAEEELLGKPKPMTAAEGVEAMQKRIAYLEEMLGADTLSGDTRRFTVRELADARQRLREYQTQRDGLN